LLIRVDPVVLLGAGQIHAGDVIPLLPGQEHKLGLALTGAKQGSQLRVVLRVLHKPFQFPPTHRLSTQLPHDQGQKGLAQGFSGEI
jgi:hypothetical protein